MGGNKRSALRWGCEPLEGRSLLSGLLVSLQAPVPQVNVAQVAESVATRAQATTGRVSAAAAGGASGGGSGSGGGSSGSTLNNYSPTSGSGVFDGNGSQNSADSTPSGPNAGAKFPIVALLGTGTPTAAELAREKFVAHFSGPMQTLAPRFTDQSKILYLRGLGGSTPNFFLHGDYALALTFPAGFDPQNPSGSAATAANPAGVPPVTGFAFLDDKNNNSGGVVGLDLLADPTSFDSEGRPTRLTFTSDPNVYGGIFYVDQSVGVVTIKYGKNTASATFNGRMYVSGLTSPFQNADLYAKHSG